jgi:hypothetical protein
MRELPPFERDEVNVTPARKNGQSGLTAWVAILPCLRRFAFEWLSSPPIASSHYLFHSKEF